MSSPMESERFPGSWSSKNVSIFHNRGRVHRRVRGNKISNLAAMTIGRFSGQDPNRPSSANLVLRLTKRNPPHTESVIPCEDETYHQELVTDKKLEVWKDDTEVNITESLTKPLPNHCFGALRRQMGLEQAKEHKGTESKDEAGESKIRRAKRAETWKPKEPISV